jgi:nucleolar GTP-binding protein
LNKLEEQEHLRELSGLYNYQVPELSQTMRDIMELAKKIREKKIIMKEESRVMKASTKPVIPRTKIRDRSVVQLKEQMENLGVDINDTKNVSITHRSI